MTDKVMFWLGVEFTHFCIAAKLQNLIDAEFFAVIDITEKAKKFFKTQKIVNFKKSWYFFDSVKPSKNNVDFDYLEHFEKKYGINLWRLAINERIFYRFYDFHRFTTHEICSILEQECKLFEKILDEVQPDFLITGVTNLHHNHLFYEICKARGIKVLTIRNSFFAGKYIISSDFHSINNMQSKDKFHFSSLVEIQNYWKKHSTISTSHSGKFLASKTDYLKAILKFLFSSNTNTKTHYTYYGRSKFAVLKGTIFSIIKKRRRESFINKNLIGDIKNKKPIIYFPLPAEPQRTTLIQAPNYTNQIDVITTIVK